MLSRMFVKRRARATQAMQRMAWREMTRTRPGSWKARIQLRAGKKNRWRGCRAVAAGRVREVSEKAGLITPMM